MTIGIRISEKAYLPEAYAYASYLENRGLKIALLKGEERHEPIDLLLQFMGFEPSFFQKPAKNAPPVIHEYSSLSVPPFARVKDQVKSLFNRTPSARIFQNEQVKEILGFSDNRPFLLRDMGVDSSFFGKPLHGAEFDLVYAGSERPGLEKVVRQFETLGMKMLLIGDFSSEFRKTFRMAGHVTFSGRMSRQEIPLLLRKCRMGLNFTPDVYPYRFQTSTKTLEYCAAGLGVISNRYAWVEKFCADRQASFLWLEDATTGKAIERFEYVTPSVSDLEWNCLLDKAGFADFLISLLK